ncbi:MAG: DoxX family protein [Proteobacteria bacterium]|nr:DoxX family protein [Pseudomonadota bacterium]
MMISRILRLADFAIAKLNAIPYAVLALIARAATFTVFWRAGTQKLDDWQGTLSLFANEYHVPILPPELAARMAATMEIGGSSLIMLGFFTRPAVLMLLGMVSVIQIFVYPTAWPDHIQWLAFMAFLLTRGPGAISLDHLLGRLLRSNFASAMPT